MEFVPEPGQDPGSFDKELKRTPFGIRYRFSLKVSPPLNYLLVALTDQSSASASASASLSSLWHSAPLISERETHKRVGREVWKGGGRRARMGYLGVHCDPVL